VRWCLAGISAAILFFSSCGYVGPVLPPSPKIPATITDLAASERGDQIIVTFTTPPRTTDGVAITDFSVIEIGVGPDQKTYNVELPSSSDRDDPQPKAITHIIPAVDLVGQHVTIAVRTAVKKSGHFSAWSNEVVLDVVAPLPTPVVHAKASADGIDLSWNASDGVQYRIARQGPNQKQSLELGMVEAGKYVDGSAQYDTEYRYVVTAAKAHAESLPSAPLTVTAVDTFAPAIPTGLTILAGPDAIDLAWQRDTEPDLQGYFVFRSVNGGPFERQGNVVTLPTYVDHNVEHGKTYSYKVSAVDKKANESGQSSVAEAQF